MQNPKMVRHLADFSASSTCGYPLLLFRYLFLCLVLVVVRDLAGSLGWSHSLDSMGL